MDSTEEARSPGSALNATSEARRKEMLDQILVMVTKMASDLKDCNAALRAARTAFVADSYGCGRKVDFTVGTGSSSEYLLATSDSQIDAKLPATALIPSLTSAPPQDADLGFPSGVTELVVSPDGNLGVVFDADDGGVDRLSHLPDPLLREIISRLPIKDVVRTAVLSRRWSLSKRAAPLLVGSVDLTVLPAGGDEIPIDLDLTHFVAAPVSRILVTHQGLFSHVRLSCFYMEEDRAQIERWLQLLVVKGMQELYRPWPLTIDKHLPTTFIITEHHHAILQINWSEHLQTTHARCSMLCPNSNISADQALSASQLLQNGHEYVLRPADCQIIHLSRLFSDVQITKSFDGELLSMGVTVLCQVSTIHATPQYIFNNHSAMVQRYYSTFVVHIQSFRPLPWPPWVFTRLFRTCVLSVSSLSLSRPPDTSSSKSYMDSICTVTFHPGILLLSAGIVMSVSLLGSNIDTLNGLCALLLKASASLATVSKAISFLVSLLSALNLSDYEQKSMLTLATAPTSTAATSVFDCFSISPVLSSGIDKLRFCTNVCTAYEVFEVAIHSSSLCWNNYKAMKACHYCISSNNLLNIIRTNHDPSSKLPKPPWLLCTAIFRLWHGKMQLVSGFLLEVTPWYLSTVYLSVRPPTQQRVQYDSTWLEMGKTCIRSTLAISVYIQTVARFTTWLVWWFHKEWIGLFQSNYLREAQWNYCQLFVEGTITEDQSVKMMYGWKPPWVSYVCRNVVGHHPATSFIMVFLGLILAEENWKCMVYSSGAYVLNFTKANLYILALSVQSWVLETFSSLEVRSFIRERGSSMLFKQLLGTMKGILTSGTNTAKSRLKEGSMSHMQVWDAISLILYNELQVPWDPGGFKFVDISRTAWGQAVFQGGKYVRDLMGYRLGWPNWRSKWAVALDLSWPKKEPWEEQHSTKTEAGEEDWLSKDRT